MPSPCLRLDDRSVSEWQLVSPWSSSSLSHSVQQCGAQRNDSCCFFIHHILTDNCSCDLLHFRWHPPISKQMWPLMMPACDFHSQQRMHRVFVQLFERKFSRERLSCLFFEELDVWPWDKPHPADLWHPAWQTLQWYRCSQLSARIKARYQCWLTGWI